MPAPDLSAAQLVTVTFPTLQVQEGTRGRQRLTIPGGGPYAEALTLPSIEALGGIVQILPAATPVDAWPDGTYVRPQDPQDQRMWRYSQAADFGEGSLPWVQILPPPQGQSSFTRADLPALLVAVDPWTQQPITPADDVVVAQSLPAGTASLTAGANVLSG